MVSIMATSSLVFMGMWQGSMATTINVIMTSALPDVASQYYGDLAVEYEAATGVKVNITLTGYNDDVIYIYDEGGREEM